MKATNDIGYDIIENSSQLAQLVSQIENETTIGVDVEADSMYHLKEKSLPDPDGNCQCQRGN